MSNSTAFLLRKFTAGDGESIESVLQKAAEQLRGLGETAVIEVRLVGNEGSHLTSVHSIDLTSDTAIVHAGHATKPALIALMRADTFQRLAAGTYSPVQAYQERKLRVYGNVGLGKRVIQQLAPQDASTDLPPTLASGGTWTIDDPIYGLGSLTITGCCFTPGGQVHIRYDMGGFGPYKKITTADSSGCFTVTEPHMKCGDIPSQPGVCVTVTAIDVDTAQEAVQTYALPCPK